DLIDDSSQAANLLPFSQFSSDLANGQLPAYSFIVPNQNNNAHDCPAGLSSCSDTQKLTAADNWLQASLDPLLMSSLFEQDGLLIITFDESELNDTAHGGGRIPFLVIGPKAKVGYQSTTFYQHQSTLRLTLELMGIKDMLGEAASAPDMTEFFK